LEEIKEICKVCKRSFNSGIWLAPQFSDEKVLLFCSKKCKKQYLKAKLERIKSGYPNYYNKLRKSKDKNTIFNEILKND
jgi:ribosomal protein L24E